MEKNPLMRFRGLEIAMDSIRMEGQLLPTNYDMSKLPGGRIEYFQKYGFKVPAFFPYIYKQYNGIKSDKYIPASLYFYYINPYLTNMNLSMAYVDKNMYFKHFPHVAQPATIIHNMCGRFFTPSGGDIREISEDDAVALLRSKSQMVIKPAIESGRGRDVNLISGKELSVEALRGVLATYQTDYIVQEIVMQHPDMLRLNPSSLNTCRLYTYRRVENGEYVLLGGAVRFGGVGEFRDNACKGGGFCKINPDGRIDDNVYAYRVFGHRSLKEIKGLVDIKVPNYGNVMDFCLGLHKTLPYMDLVGWDVAITEDEKPMLIELNQYPDCEFLQIFNGPMFGDYTDALLERVSHHKLASVEAYKRSFENGRPHYQYNFEVGKAFSI